MNVNVLTAFPHSPKGSASRACFFFFFNKFFKIYFWLHWVFVAARRLSVVAVSGSYSPVAVLGLLIAVVSLLEHRL